MVMKKKKEEKSLVKVIRDRRGFIERVENPRGKKGVAFIVQRATGPSGFTIINSRNRKIGFSRTEPNAFKKAVALGRRKVISRN